MEIKKERWIPCKPRCNTNWNKDIFYEVCSVLLHDCAVLELVCLQFCDYMSSNDLWFRLYNIYYPESNNLPETENVRTEFFSPLYHWDEDLYEKALNEKAPYSPITYSDLRFHDDRRTIEEITNRKARWKVAKCLEPLPRTEGKFFCFAMDVIRCETNNAYVPMISSIQKEKERRRVITSYICMSHLLTFSYVGFGISPQLSSIYEYINGKYPRACPWVWHSLSEVDFIKGDQVGVVGCVKDGYYLCNFFINDKFYPWYKYETEDEESTHLSPNVGYSNYYISSEKEAFVHLAIVTGEKFTITRPKLGNIYYYNKFKESDAYKQGILYRSK